jgi:hypothetical protein
MNKNIAFYFLICACLVIFFISCNLIGCRSGQLFTISGPWSKRVLFSDKLRSEDNFQAQNSTKKIYAVDSKDSKIQ